MEMFLSILHKLSLSWQSHESHPENNPDLGLRLNTYKSSPLHQLPPELILHIASFLPPTSAAVFSVSCRNMLFIIGTAYIETLKRTTTISSSINHSAYVKDRPMLALDGSSQRFQFLSLLERDLPDHIACLYCEKLHPISDAPAYIWHPGLTTISMQKCIQASRQMLIGLVVDLSFNVSVFKMAMKRYHQGQEYSSLLDLLTVERNFRTKFFVESQKVQFRIVSGSLLLHKQVILTVAHDNAGPFSWKHMTICICPHSGTISSESSEEDLTQFRAILRRAWLGWKRSAFSSEASRCAFCASEVQIDFRTTEEYYLEVSVSIWKDLGSGSLHDAKWLRHIVGVKDLCWERAEKTAYSIQATFEGSEHSDAHNL
jgi:hypothetical protein